MESLKVENVIQEGLHLYKIRFSNGQEIILHEDLLVKYRLLAGKEIHPSEIEELQSEEQIHTAYAKAVHYLSYRPRSILEVKEYLRKKETAQAIIEHVIHRLIQQGYLDDRVFAQKWIEHRQLLKPKGRFALAAELRNKGMDEAIISDVLSTIEEQEEIKHARRLAQKKAKTLAGKPWSEVRPKLGRFLANKGYSMGVVLEVLVEIEKEFLE